MSSASEDTGGMQDVDMDRTSWQSHRYVEVEKWQPYRSSHSKEVMVAVPLDYGNIHFCDGNMQEDACKNIVPGNVLLWAGEECRA